MDTVGLLTDAIGGAVDGNVAIAAGVESLGTLGQLHRRRAGAPPAARF